MNTKNFQGGVLAGVLLAVAVSFLSTNSCWWMPVSTFWRL